MLAWHFIGNDRKLRHDANCPEHKGLLVEEGQKLTVDDPLALCGVGLHASKRAIDALNYAPGSIACRVELSGEILEGDDKVCATERTVLQMLDATNILHEFACWCAEQALLKEREAGQEPDPRSWAAIEAKRKWLRGEITDSELETAKDAARDAAKTAAYTAWAAAYAADQTARVAAWAAARDAAWDAAWAAARAAVREAAWDAAGNAAWDAAGNAAWDAARAATSESQNTQLEKMLLEAMETI